MGGVTKSFSKPKLPPPPPPPPPPPTPAVEVQPPVTAAAAAAPQTRRDSGAVVRVGAAGANTRASGRASGGSRSTRELDVLGGLGRGGISI